MRTEPTKQQKELYKKIATRLGADSKVIEYGDDSNTNSIYILNCPDPIDNKVMFYCSIGLFEYPIDDKRYEILMAGYSKYDTIPNILSTCAFFVIKNNWKCTYGNVFETLVEMYCKNTEMKHILFTSPFLWEDKLVDFNIEGKPIDFVLAIPISDKELEYKNKFGTDALETLFEKESIDIFDINRKSIV